MQKLELDEIDRVATYLTKIPGIGFKSAKRYAIWLGEHKTETSKLTEALKKLIDNVTTCKKCFNLTTSKDGLCEICKNPERDASKICVVQSIENLVEIEQSNVYNGFYFVLGGVISPLYNTEHILKRIEYLKRRVKEEHTREVILVLSSTTEGDLTVHYIKETLKGTNVKISKVASGIPVGTDINYVDKRTLAEALRSRVYI